MTSFSLFSCFCFSPRVGRRQFRCCSYFSFPLSHPSLSLPFNPKLLMITSYMSAIKLPKGARTHTKKHEQATWKNSNCSLALWIHMSAIYFHNCIISCWLKGGGRKRSYYIQHQHKARGEDYERWLHNSALTLQLLSSSSLSHMLRHNV